MAINLISQAKKYSCPFRCAVYHPNDGFRYTPTRLDFGYYLAEGGGTRLQEDKKYKPFAINTDFHRNFKSIARNWFIHHFQREAQPFKRIATS
ncbi:MAG: hypothetical protein IPM42_22270 [Saprospiraceae bacterium]|nr:hypothetical protein [Saprospiraceae bacterium]